MSVFRILSILLVSLSLISLAAAQDYEKHSSYDAEDVEAEWYVSEDVEFEDGDIVMSEGSKIALHLDNPSGIEGFYIDQEWRPDNAQTAFIYVTNSDVSEGYHPHPDEATYKAVMPFDGLQHFDLSDWDVDKEDYETFGVKYTIDYVDENSNRVEELGFLTEQPEMSQMDDITDDRVSLADGDSEESDEELEDTDPNVEEEIEESLLENTYIQGIAVFGLILFITLIVVLKEN